MESMRINDATTDLGAVAHDPGDVAALIAVTSVPDVPGQAEETLRGLATAMRDAVRGDAAAIWVAGRPVEGGQPPVVVGAGDEAAERLATALDGAIAPEAEIRTAPDAAPDGPFPGAVAALGAAHGLVVPMRVGDIVGGAVIVGARSALDNAPLRRHAVRVGAACAGRVVQGARLRANLERAMAQILLTDERMLGRMGLDIHDGPTQQLSVALLEVQLLEAELSDAAAEGLPTPETLMPAVGRIYETVGGALHEMRELIGHLRPAQFEDRRLSEILQDAITAFEARTDCEVTAEWEGEFPVNGVSITQRITLYRILQETLTNAHRHGRARHVRVRVAEDDAGVRMEVKDDGVGFDPATLPRRRPGQPLARFGVHGMGDRAQLLGGTFEINSAPGAGTRVRVFLPRWHGDESDVPA